MGRSLRRPRHSSTCCWRRCSWPLEHSAVSCRREETPISVEIVTDAALAQPSPLPPTAPPAAAAPQPPQQAATPAPPPPAPKAAVKPEPGPPPPPPQPREGRSASRRLHRPSPTSQAEPTEPAPKKPEPPRSPPPEKPKPPKPEPAPEKPNAPEKAKPEPEKPAEAAKAAPKSEKPKTPPAPRSRPNDFDALLRRVEQTPKRVKAPAKRDGQGQLAARQRHGPARHGQGGADQSVAAGRQHQPADHAVLEHPRRGARHRRTARRAQHRHGAGRRRPVRGAHRRGAAGPRSRVPCLRGECGPRGPCLLAAQAAPGVLSGMAQHHLQLRSLADDRMSGRIGRRRCWAARPPCRPPCSAARPALAQLRVDITSGVVQPMPIAVSPFSGDSPAAQALGSRDRPGRERRPAELGAVRGDRPAGLHPDARGAARRRRASPTGGRSTPRRWSPAMSRPTRAA